MRKKLVIFITIVFSLTLMLSLFSYAAEVQIPNVGLYLYVETYSNPGVWTLASTSPDIFIDSETFVYRFNFSALYNTYGLLKGIHLITDRGGYHSDANFSCKQLRAEVIGDSQITSLSYYSTHYSDESPLWFEQKSNDPNQFQWFGCVRYSIIDVPDLTVMNMNYDHFYITLSSNSPQTMTYIDLYWMVPTWEEQLYWYGNWIDELGAKNDPYGWNYTIPDDSVRLDINDVIDGNVSSIDGTLNEILEIPNDFGILNSILNCSNLVSHVFYALTGQRYYTDAYTSTTENPYGNQYNDELGSLKWVWSLLVFSVIFVILVCFVARKPVKISDETHQSMGFVGDLSYSSKKKVRF